MKDDVDSKQSKLIVAAALEKFRQFGPRRVTVDEIARHLRISKKTIYRHFSDKGALVSACVDHIASGVLPAVQRALNAEGSVAERLARALDMVSVVPRMLSSQLIADIRTDYPDVWQAIDARRRMVIAQYERLIEEGVAAGDLRPEIHHKVAMRVIGAVVQQVMVPEVLGTGEFTPEQAFNTVRTMLLHGVLARPERQAPRVRRKRRGVQVGRSHNEEPGK